MGDAEIVLRDAQTVTHDRCVFDELIKRGTSVVALSGIDEYESTPLLFPSTLSYTGNRIFLPSYRLEKKAMHTTIIPLFNMFCRVD